MWFRLPTHIPYEGMILTSFSRCLFMIALNSNKFAKMTYYMLLNSIKIRFEPNLLILHLYEVRREELLSKVIYIRLSTEILIHIKMNSFVFIDSIQNEKELLVLLFSSSSFSMYFDIIPTKILKIIWKWIKCKAATTTTTTRKRIIETHLTKNCLTGRLYLYLHIHLNIDMRLIWDLYTLFLPILLLNCIYLIFVFISFVFVVIKFICLWVDQFSVYQCVCALCVFKWMLISIKKKTILRFVFLNVFGGYLKDEKIKR